MKRRRLEDGSENEILRNELDDVVLDNVESTEDLNHTNSSQEIHYDPSVSIF